jgi:hypothetical protein
MDQIMQSLDEQWEIKYSRREIEIFQRILYAVSIGNIPKLREHMHTLSLNELSRFHQFRKDYLTYQRSLKGQK